MRTRILSMMMICGLLAIGSCDEDSDPTVPACIREKIVQLRQQDPMDYAIARLVTESDDIYYSIGSEACCDFSTMIVDEECNYICSIGGWSSADDCQFTIKKSVIIWKDFRQVD